jgi:predicted nucleotidyltransferase component of viral defense system
MDRGLTMVMLSGQQVKEYVKTLKINESFILREFVQYTFLKELYMQTFSENIFFKGGTAIRIIFNGERFSEDLDFSVVGSKDTFTKHLLPFFKQLSQPYGWDFKKRNSMIGEKYLLSVQRENMKFGLYIELDFSFREDVLQPSKSTIHTIYPIVFTSFVHHLSKEEILAEKISAIFTRYKGRDIYDIWYLLNLGAELDEDLILQKLKYYDILNFDKKLFANKIQSFEKKQFVKDLRPFIPINQRQRLPEFYEVVLAYIQNKLNQE